MCVISRIQNRIEYIFPKYLYGVFQVRPPTIVITETILGLVRSLSHSKIIKLKIEGDFGEKTDSFIIKTKRCNKLPLKRLFQILCSF